MRLDDSVLASLLLTNRLVDVSAKPLTAGEYWTLIAAVQDPATLLGRSATDLAGHLPGKLTGERIATLLDAGTALAFELEQLEQSGIRAISPFDEPWPERLTKRLGNASPSVLYVAGPVDLLATDGLGIVGSRNVDEAGADVARSAARVAVDLGVPVVSGGARGVDQLSMAAALAAGGTAVGILADSLTKALRAAETRSAVIDGTACLATPYKPSAGFSAASAMGRNKAIYGLSRLTLVVATDVDKGGTWGGATEALKKRYGRVAVWRGAGEGPGNDGIEHLGAIAVSDTDALRAAFETDEQPEPRPVAPSEPVQQSLL